MTPIGLVAIREPDLDAGQMRGFLGQTCNQPRLATRGRDPRPMPSAAAAVGDHGTGHGCESEGRMPRAPAPFPVRLRDGSAMKPSARLCDDIAMFCSPVDLRYSRHTVSTGWLQARADSVPVKDA